MYVTVPGGRGRMCENQPNYDLICAEIMSLECILRNAAFGRFMRGRLSGIFLPVLEAILRDPRPRELSRRYGSDECES